MLRVPPESLFGLGTIVLFCGLAYGVWRAGWLTRGERGRLDAATEESSRIEELSHPVGTSGYPNSLHRNLKDAGNRLPPEETTQQIDPLLRLSGGRASRAVIALLAIFVAILLGVVLYGLNSSMPTLEKSTLGPKCQGRPPLGADLEPQPRSAKEQQQRSWLRGVAEEMAA